MWKRNLSKFSNHFQAIEAQKGKPAIHLPVKRNIPGIKHVICVASGKGGVGKSTTSVNLALSLSLKNKSVALLDCDLFGPSIPRMMGMDGYKANVVDGLFEPLINYGVKTMSMGYLVNESEPVVWRGMMVMKCIQQLLFQTNWNNTDILILDLPPGYLIIMNFSTGDIQLSISQLVKNLVGSVVVSTPQDIALLDVKKAIGMFQKVNIPILGIIQNMSHFHCPKCNHPSFIFGHDGVTKFANSNHIPFLGNVPLDINICTTSDNGKPIVILDPNSAHSQIYSTIADDLLLKIK